MIRDDFNWVCNSTAVLAGSKSQTPPTVCSFGECFKLSNCMNSFLLFVKSWGEIYLTPFYDTLSLFVMPIWSVAVPLIADFLVQNLQGMTGTALVAGSPIRHNPSVPGHPVEVQTYQPPWKALSEFALQSDLDQPAFQQLVSEKIFYLHLRFAFFFVFILYSLKALSDRDFF